MFLNILEIHAILLVHICLLIVWNSEILPSFALYLTANIDYPQCNTIHHSTMASHNEMSRLTDMNITTGSGRHSRNSQRICNTLLQPTMPTNLLPEIPVNPATIPSTPVNVPISRSIYCLIAAATQLQILLTPTLQLQSQHMIGRLRDLHPARGNMTGLLTPQVSHYNLLQ